MSARTYRLIYTALGVALVATVGIAIRFGSPAGESPILPAPLEAITPGDGEQVLRQAFLQIDLPVGYEIDLIVDGFQIPESEIGYVAGTGVFTWSPGAGRSFLEWSAGEHEVTVRWNTILGLADPGEHSWRFRVY
jgi:hypothetical protein